MNTEDRLRDALHTAARTITNPPPLPARRSAFTRPLAAALAVAAVLGGIATLAADRFLIPSPVSSQVLSPTAPQKIAVYLCIDRSSNPACHGGATDRQRQAVAERLRSLPEVRSVVYESQAEAYDRFRELFENTPGFIAGTDPGDIPDSFRVEAAPDSVSAIDAALDGLSGIDRVVAEPVRTP